MKIIESAKASKTFLNAWVSLNKALGDMEDKAEEADDKEMLTIIKKVYKGLHEVDKTLDSFSNMIKYT